MKMLHNIIILKLYAEDDWEECNVLVSATQPPFSAENAENSLARTVVSEKRHQYGGKQYYFNEKSI